MTNSQTDLRALIKRLKNILRTWWDTSHWGTILRIHLNHVRAFGTLRTTAFNLWLVTFWVRSRMTRRRYCILDTAALKSTRKSDTVFIFGSGYSLWDISEAEWDQISSHDTFGLNYFVREPWIPIDYHYVRELTAPEDNLSASGWLEANRDFAKELSANPHYRDTTLFIQSDIMGHVGNILTGHQMLPAGQKLYNFKAYRGPLSPSPSFEYGVPRSGAVCSALNIALLTGWKHVVLAGVDLYDTRYFWLDYDESREGIPVDTPHPESNRHGGLVNRVRYWSECLVAEDVSLSVYNPKSLLSAVIPVYGQRETVWIEAG